MAKATTASATAAEKDAEKVQAVENTTTEEKAAKTANTQAETVKLITLDRTCQKQCCHATRFLREQTKRLKKNFLSFLKSSHL